MSYLENLPIHRIDHRHAGLFVLEIVFSFAQRKSSYFLCSSWLRLYDPKGHVLSFWFFLEINRLLILWQFLRHLRPRRVESCFPDVYEAITPTKDQLITPIEITEESYWSLIEWVN